MLENILVKATKLPSSSKAEKQPRLESFNLIVNALKSLAVSMGIFSDWLCIFCHSYNDINSD